MPHVVCIDWGDHFEVLADYSTSPRHAKLTASEWEREYAIDASYAAMRATHPGSMARIAPRSNGKWTKDWSTRFQRER